MNQQKKTDKIQVIEYLNLKTGKQYRNTKYIEARLKEGYTVADLIKIIDNKLQDPFFIENKRFLNPVTLFRPIHADNYLNEDPEKDYKKEQNPDSIYYKRAGIE